MNIIIISPEKLVDNEAFICNELLELNVRLHIRKPSWSYEKLQRFLDQLNPIHYSKISLHQHHHLVYEYNLGGVHWKSDQAINEKTGNNTISKSFHSLKDIRSEKKRLTYGFLSPIFNSISKQEYHAAFDLMKLKSELENGLPFPVYALGGIEPRHGELLKNIGFQGMAILGWFWSDNKYKRRLIELKKVTHGNS